MSQKVKVGDEVFMLTSEQAQALAPYLHKKPSEIRKVLARLSKTYCLHADIARQVRLMTDQAIIDAFKQAKQSETKEQIKE